MEAIQNSDDIVVPDGVQIDIDPTAVEAVEPNFVDTIEPVGVSTPSPEPAAGEPAPDPAGATASGPDPQSSITDQPVPDGSEPKPTGAPEPQPVAEVNEESVLQFLSEKLGQPVESLDKLLKPEPADPFGGDSELKAIAEWRERTGRPISDWVKFQKDYDAMSHDQVAREYLQYKYPDFTPEEIELEMQEYLPQEDDLDKEIARKQLNLKKLATDGRRELKNLLLELDTPVQPKLTQEQSQALEFYQKSMEAQQRQKELGQINDQNLNKAIQDFDTIPLTLDKDVEITFKPTPEARKSLRDYMARPDWYNQDGTLNAKEVVADSFFLQNREAIIQEAYQQGLAAGKADIEKKTGNVTLDGRKTADGEAPRQSDIIIEGLEDMEQRSIFFR